MCFSHGRLLLIAGVTLSCGQSPVGPLYGELGGLTLAVEQVASGLDRPVHLSAPTGDTRLFVVEQRGRIRIVENGATRPVPFLDISGRVSCCGERGLLSVAFHPRYASNGFFYVNFTDANGNTRVERFQVSADRNVADAASATLIIGIPQPYENHNGGLVAFGPDGMLYVGMGDGGGGGDPLRAGQDLGTLLGKMLRLDVDGALPYRVPTDNPFRQQAGARPEIWALGLRNPWRFAFDAAAGLLYVADVGQNRLEEVNVVSAGEGGLNFGWNVMEGSSCYASTSCDQSGLVLPEVEYEHSAGCSITGGHAYRGTRIAELRGHYLYSDYCSGWLRSFRHTPQGAVDRKEWAVGNLGNVTSFGEDGAGEVYIVATSGRVLRIVRGAATP